jgi:hypothetical protein
MAESNTNVRLLSVDVRSAKFGFVVFEGPDTLLDFGVRSYTRQCGPINATAGRSFLRLVDLHAPSLIVLRVAPSRLDKRTRRAKIAARALRQISKRRSIPLRCLSRGTIKKFFRSQGLTTKHRIASFLAERFPDLAWKLPPQRRLWQPERHRMSVFDAAAAGVAFIDRLSA